MYHRMVFPFVFTTLLCFRLTYINTLLFVSIKYSVLFILEFAVCVFVGNGCTVYIKLYIKVEGSNKIHRTVSWVEMCEEILVIYLSYIL